VLVSGTNGITVQAGASDVVTRRNISINGIGSGIKGVKFVSGKALHIEHCTIASFTNHGIDIEPSAGGGQAFVQDTVSQDNGGSGISAVSTAIPVQVSIDDSRFDHSAFGVAAQDFSWFTIRNSQASGNSQVGFLARANADTAVVSIANSTAGNNATGIQAGGGAATYSIRLAEVSVFLNVAGLVTGTNGAIASFGNNYNSGSGVPTASITPR
jgi:hypothetical protein